MRSFPTSGEHLRDRTEKLLSGPHACTAEQELTLACPHERHRARRDSDLVTVQRGAGAPHELAAHPVMEKVLPAEQCPLTPCRGRVCPVTQSSISSRSEFYLFSREGLTQPSEACGLRHDAAPAGAAVGWTGKALEALRASLSALPPITEDCSNAWFFVEPFYHCVCSVFSRPCCLDVSQSVARLRSLVLRTRLSLRGVQRTAWSSVQAESHQGPGAASGVPCTQPCSPWAPRWLQLLFLFCAFIDL